MTTLAMQQQVIPLAAELQATVLVNVKMIEAGGLLEEYFLLYLLEIIHSACSHIMARDIQLFKLRV